MNSTGEGARTHVTLSSAIGKQCTHVCTKYTDMYCMYVCVYVCSFVLYKAPSRYCNA